MNPENEAKKAYLDLQNENARLRSEVANQAEEIKNRGDTIDSLIDTMKVLKKHLGATEGETSHHLISRLEKAGLAGSPDQAREIKKLEAALASCNPHLPFWVGEAPLNPGPRGSRYAIFNAHETWFIREGKDREECLGLCHTICEMLNGAWSMARGKE